MPTFTASEVVTAAKLNSATARDWTTWTPTLTNLTLGSGTVTARYCQLGSELVFGMFNFTLGTGSAVGTSPQFSLPVTASSSYTGLTPNIGVGRLNDASGADWMPALSISTTTATILYVDGSSNLAGITASLPFVWVTTDQIFVQFFYEAA